MVNEDLDDFPRWVIEAMLNVWDRHVVVNEGVTDGRIPLGFGVQGHCFFP